MNERSDNHEVPGASPEGLFRGGLAVLSGPSGSGKTSLCRALLEDPRLVLSVSATTRLPRPGEQSGVDYCFFSREEFESSVDRGEFVEWAEVYGNLYGTLRGPLEEASRWRERMMLLDIDVQGAIQLQERSIAAVYLFVAPPSLEELRQRLVRRSTDTPEVIDRRLESASREMAEQHRYDYVLVNHDLAATIAAARRILGLATGSRGC